MMYARVTVVEGSPDKVDEGIELFNSQVVPVVQGVDGYRGALLLVDRDTGKGMGITLWESEEGRQRAAKAVQAAREATITAMGATVPPVDEYDVVSHDL